MPRTVKQLFQVTEQLIRYQPEIVGLTVIDWTRKIWRATSLLSDRAVEIMTAKTYVCSDSALCLGGIPDEPVKIWEKQNSNGIWNLVVLKSRSNRWRDDGIRVEKFHRIQNIWNSGILVQIQNFMAELQCELEKFRGRIIFMSVYNDIDWNERNNQDKCIIKFKVVSNYARKFRSGCWSFLGPGSEKKWYGTFSDKPDENGTLQRNR